MFTGIVQGVGRIVHSERRGEGVRLVIDVSGLGARDVAIGDSIAVNGCCLTVVAAADDMLSFDASAETLRCTAGLDRAGSVNLEKSLRMGDLLGGHLMSGHVDGVGTVHSVVPVAGADGSVTFTVQAPAELARLIAVKGSIAVQGVSLTVNTVEGTRFAVNLIPHTLAVTTLAQLAPGDRVNLEVDVIARYVARMMEETSRD